VNKEIEIQGNIYGGGVYAFAKKDTGEILYVGSSLKEINNRLSSFKSVLKRGLLAKGNKVILQENYDKGNLVFKGKRQTNRYIECMAIL